MVLLDIPSLASPWIIITIMISMIPLVVVYLYLSWHFNYFKTMDVPYIKPTLFFGNFAERLLFRKSVSEEIQEIYQQFEGYPICGVFEGRRPNLMIRDPILIRNVMVRDFDCFMDRRSTFSIRPESPMENTLINLKGSSWKDVRHVSTPIFTSGKIKMMARLVADCTQQMINYLDQHHSDKEIEMKEFFGRFTLDVIASCAFGIQCDSLSNPKSEFVNMVSKFNKITLIKRIALFMSQIIFESGWLAKLFGASFINLETEEYLSNVILETKKRGEIESPKPLGKMISSRRVDFLQLMLNAQSGNLKSEYADFKEDTDLFARDAQLKNIAPKPPISAVTDKVLIGQSILFLLAGFETSSTLLTFASYELALNPEIQQRARTEVQEVLARHNDICTYEAIAEMSYLDNILNETLRKHPPEPRVPRVCTVDLYQVDRTKARLRKGDQILIPIRGLHYDPQYYPEPEKFDPDRFLPENKQKRSPYVFLPFGSGPRNCIGMRFAMMSTKLAMASLLNVYTLEPCARTEVPYKISVSTRLLKAADGIYLKLRKLA